MQVWVRRCLEGLYCSAPLPWGRTHSRSRNTNTHCPENRIYLFPEKGIARPQSIFLHSCVCERFIDSQDRSTYLAAAKYVDQSWEYINLSQIYECRNWETEHYNYVLEIMRLHSFISGKWEPDIYIGFSPALHLQCEVRLKGTGLHRHGFSWCAVCDSSAMRLLFWNIFIWRTKQEYAQFATI
jgi:hypothetical protein